MTAASNPLTAITLTSPRAQTGTGPRPRYTLDGNDALEGNLERTCSEIAGGVLGLISRRKLQAIFLGGGYGRGEGGVLRGAGGDRPYNDLEFYVAIEGNRHVNEFLYRRRLDVLGEILTHLADVEVEFKITSLEEIRAWPVSMFSYDLAVGHRVLWEGTRADSHHGWGRHLNPENIPRAEASRLLMNRCSGLLFARSKLELEPLTVSNADFVGRNIAKAQLAFGDALLAESGLYHWSCRERHRRLERLSQRNGSPMYMAALRHHAAGLQFKLHPSMGAAERGALSASHGEVSAFAEVCWLHLEEGRLGRLFPSARAYAEDPCDKFPGSAPLFNVALNLRADNFVPRSRPNPFRHPRQRIYHAMSLLLWVRGLEADLPLRTRVESELNLPPGTFGNWAVAYRALWGRIR